MRTRSAVTALLRARPLRLLAGCGPERIGLDDDAGAGGGGGGDDSMTTAATASRACRGDTQCTNCIDDDGDGRSTATTRVHRPARRRRGAPSPPASRATTSTRRSRTASSTATAAAARSTPAASCPSRATRPSTAASTPESDCDADRRSCIDECAPITPPGCDCFGCCTVCAPGTGECHDILINQACRPTARSRTWPAMTASSARSRRPATAATAIRTRASCARARPRTTCRPSCDGERVPRRRRHLRHQRRLRHRRLLLDRLLHRLDRLTARPEKPGSCRAAQSAATFRRAAATDVQGMYSAAHGRSGGA